MTGEWQSYMLFAVVILLVIWVLFRLKRQRTPGSLQAAMGMISCVNDNLKRVNTRLADPLSTKKFKTGDWKRYRYSLVFLDAGTVEALKESFKMIEEFNQRIDAAKANKAPASLQDMPVENLRTPLLKAKEGLAQWLRSNISREMSNRRNLMGF